MLSLHLLQQQPPLLHLYMSSHYEGTSLAMDQDVGAGEFVAPYRTRPLVWKYNDQTYANERPIATQ